MEHMKFVRESYGVPAYRGSRVKFDGKPAVIVAARGGYLHLRVKGLNRIAICHPTWHMEYLPAKKSRRTQRAADLAVCPRCQEYGLRIVDTCVGCGYDYSPNR